MERSAADLDWPTCTEARKLIGQQGEKSESADKEDQLGFEGVSADVEVSARNS